MTAGGRYRSVNHIALQLVYSCKVFVTVVTICDLKKCNRGLDYFQIGGIINTISNTLSTD